MLKIFNLTEPDLTLMTKDEINTSIVSPITNELTEQRNEAKAITLLAEGINRIANYIERGGLTKLLSGYARSQAVANILGGLASADGRDSLDARTLKQNAIEITKAIEACFDKYQEVMDVKARADNIDPVIHDGEGDFKSWLKKKELENK